MIKKSIWIFRISGRGGDCLSQPEAKPPFFKRRAGNVYRLLG
jgi:hypothetical protein